MWNAKDLITVAWSLGTLVFGTCVVSKNTLLQVHDVDALRLRRRNALIEGRVVDLDGRPIPGASVTVSSEN